MSKLRLEDVLEVQSRLAALANVMTMTEQLLAAREAEQSGRLAEVRLIISWSVDSETTNVEHWVLDPGEIDALLEHNAQEVVTFRSDLLVFYGVQLEEGEKPKRFDETRGGQLIEAKA